MSNIFFVILYLLIKWKTNIRKHKKCSSFRAFTSLINNMKKWKTQSPIKPLIQIQILEYHMDMTVHTIDTNVLD